MTTWACCSAIGAPAPVDAGVGSVVVTVVGIKADQGGSLVVILFRDKESWLDGDKAFLKAVANVESDSMTVTFEDVPRDSAYAVEVIHDKNGNGRLDMRKFPYPRPKEGAGVSNNTFRLGPPAYDKARFALAVSFVFIRVAMRY
jgi:uncharacterized protein (DUF2141 family)